MLVLRVSFPDKYRLWTEMVRGRTDRMFIPTGETPTIGAQVRVELLLPELVLPIVVEGSVVGRRGLSARFETGVYLHFQQDQIEKVRQFLGLANGDRQIARGRRHRRVHATLTVRISNMPNAEPGITKNLSTTGLLLAIDELLVQGQRLSLGLESDGEVIELYAEVAWADHERKQAGLCFLDMTDQSSDFLGQLVERLHQEAEAGRGLGGPIVIGDDDPEILAMLKTVVSRFGYEIHEALLGDEALSLIQRLLPRLVILDVLMPGIDGTDICRAMRADEETIDVPVIFLSALEPAKLHEIAEEAGATDYLSKPVNLNEFIKLVGQYLGA